MGEFSRPDAINQMVIAKIVPPVLLMLLLLGCCSLFQSSLANFANFRCACVHLLDYVGAFGLDVLI